MAALGAAVRFPPRRLAPDFFCFVLEAQRRQKRLDGGDPSGMTNFNDRSTLFGPFRFDWRRFGRFRAGTPDRCHFWRGTSSLSMSLLERCLMAPGAGGSRQRGLSCVWFDCSGLYEWIGLVERGLLLNGALSVAQGFAPSVARRALAAPSAPFCAGGSPEGQSGFAWSRGDHSYPPFPPAWSPAAAARTAVSSS